MNKELEEIFGNLKIEKDKGKRECQLNRCYNILWNYCGGDFEKYINMYLIELIK